MKRIAIMQPYIFPYVGYFQLIEAVDVFVFYDDVNFIKGGWINRNRTLASGREQLFTIPCQGISSNKQINEIEVQAQNKWREKLIKSIRQAYSKAPFFDIFFPVVEELIFSEVSMISELAMNSIRACSDYIGQNTSFNISSVDFPETKGMDRADRLIAISKKMAAENYINPQGGMELYDKAYFASNDIRLDFLKAAINPYPQIGSKEFVPGLSIIDLLMHIQPEEVQFKYLKNYALI
ncbi:MAG: WbqC family protein [Saprospiraceae bacterium]|nr:WbqC family protein [Saprospiraceae bacterium]